jgi:nucleotide-binding universal stress UspA family protein
MPKRILVPVDGSDRAMATLEYAVETFPDASITAFHVVELGRGDLGAFSAMTGNLPDSRAAEERSAELREAATQRSHELGTTIDTDRGYGRPDRLIVKYADEEGYDLIVIGSHGRDGVARVLLGSVAEAVTRRASVPVLVVR